MRRKIIDKKQAFRAIAISLAWILTLLCFPVIDHKGPALEVQAAKTLSNPRIKSSSSTVSGQVVTWDCVWMGSYPQTEIVDKPDTSGAYNMPWSTASDYEVNPNLYARLKTVSGWDGNGDIVLDGVKYRRITEEDTESEMSAYDWDRLFSISYNSQKYHYFRYDKIKWRVLNVSGDRMFLLSDKVLDSRWDDADNKPWEKSTIRSWLNTTFYNSAFSYEKNAIVTTTLDNKNTGDEGSRYGGNATNDRVFLLATYDVYKTSTAAAYGFCKNGEKRDEARRCKSSTFAKAMGAGAVTTGANCGNTFWGLRSPNGVDDGNSRLQVGNDGILEFYLAGGTEGFTDIRPALNVKLSPSRNWTYAGTVSTDGIVKEQGGKPATAPRKITYKDISTIPEPIPGESIKLFENAKGSTDDDLAKLFPGDYSLTFPLINTTVSKTNNGDGTYTFRYAMGLDKNVLTTQDAWKNLKEDMQSAEAAVNQKKKLSALMKKYHLKTGSFTITKQLKAKPSMDVIGYYEYVTDENGRTISDGGGIIAELSWSASTTRQFLAGPCPVYIKLGGELTGNFSGDLKYKNKKVSVNANVSIQPEFYVKAGVGIEGAIDAGVKGAAKLKVQVHPPIKGDLTGYASITYTIVFVADNEYTIAEKTVPLFDYTGKFKAQKALSMASAQEKAKYSLTDRSYQDKTSAWNGRAAKSRTKTSLSSTANNGVTLKNLQSYILPDTIPLMEQHGDDIVMVFQANDKGRDTANSVKLMSSVFDGATWSEPQAIYDNGTLDSFADLRKIGDDLYLVWQKEKEILTGDSSTQEGMESLINSIGENSEICAAKYDPATRTFGNAEFLTDDSSSDITPILAENESKPTVIWINTGNDITGVSDTNTIMMSDYSEGHWSTPQALGTVRERISELAATGNNGQLYTAFITTDDSFSQHLYLLKDNAFTEITPEDTLVSGLQAKDGSFYYGQDGQIICYSPESSSTKAIISGESQCIGADALLCRTKNKEAFVWMDNTEEGCRIYSSVRIAEGEYSEPVTLFESNEMIGKRFYALSRDDGSWDMILTSEDINNQENTSMYYLSRLSAPKLEMDSVLINPSQQDGTQQEFCYVVKNNSEEPVDTFSIKTSDASGTITEKTVDKAILPGESLYLEDTFNASGLDGEHTVTTEVLAQGQIDDSNTKAETELSFEDVSLSVEKQVYDDRIDFIATIKNEGKKDATGTVTLYQGAESNTVLETETYSELPAGESETMIFSRALGDISLDSNGTYDLRIEAKNNLPEYDTGNNTYYGTVYEREVKPEGGVTPTKPAGNDTATTTTQTQKATTVPVSKITLAGISKKIAAGKKIRLNAKIFPKDATKKKLKWSTNNKKVATVTQTGWVTVKKKAGGKTVSITAAATDGSGKRAIWKIKVMKGIVKKVTIKGAKASLKAGKTMKLKAVVKATKGANKKVKWTTSNKKWATVTATGKVKALPAGKGKTVKITVMATDGSNKKAFKKIKIK